MKGLDSNTLILSKSSPIKFFCTNIDGKEVKVLVDDKRDIELINFLIYHNIFDTNTKVFTINTEISNIILGEPLNELVEDFNIDLEISYIDESLLDFYRQLSSKEFASTYVEQLGIKKLKNKRICSLDNYSGLMKSVCSLSFPYVIKTFNGKGGKGTFVVSNQTELDTVISILSDKVVWEKSEKLNDIRPIVLIEEYISNKVDININIEFYEEDGKTNFNVLGITQQLTEGTLYRGNVSIDRDIKGLEDTINSIAKKLLYDGYIGNIGIDLMYDNDGNLYFNEFNTRFNCSTLFTQFIKNDNYSNSEVVLFQTRNGVVDLHELQEFLLEDGIKGNVLPYEVNWDKGTIIFLLKGASISRFMNQNISTQNSNKSELKEKRKLLTQIRERGFYEVRFDMCSKSQSSSQKYYEGTQVEILDKEFPLIVLTGPRGAGKNYFSEQFLSLYGNLIDFVPQITYREPREDDVPKYIQIITQQEFNDLKDEMFVSSGKYGILKDDINKVILSGKIPISILGWKEILKLERRQKTGLLIFNITYPINNNGILGSNTVDTMKNERFLKRGWSNNEKNDNIVLVKKYMNLFFNHPTFRGFFDYTHTTTLDSDDDFILNFGNTIQKIINGGNI